MFSSMQRLGVIMRGQVDNPDEVMGVLNPATARAPDGTLYLFPRVVAAGNYSRIGIAKVIFDGDNTPIGVERCGYALEPSESYERNRKTAGCEDARITFVEPLGCYVMTYTAYGPLGPRVALATSTDLLKWERLGPARFAFDPKLRVDFDLYDNKDAMLFPEPVFDPHGNLALAMIHRPGNVQGYCTVLPEGVTETRASMWISYCPLAKAKADQQGITHWQDHQLLAVSEQPWEILKIGGGTPPICIPQGWLIFYHGVSGEILPNVDQQPNVYYSAGAMLLDQKDPRKILARTSEPLLKPDVAEERVGIVDNVVFPTGIDMALPGHIDVYYGMADAAIGVARMKLPE